MKKLITAVSIAAIVGSVSLMANALGKPDARTAAANTTVPDTKGKSILLGKDVKTTLGQTDASSSSAAVKTTTLGDDKRSSSIVAKSFILPDWQTLGTFKSDTVMAESDATIGKGTNKTHLTLQKSTKDESIPSHKSKIVLKPVA